MDWPEGRQPGVGPGILDQADGIDRRVLVFEVHRQPRGVEEERERAVIGCAVADQPAVAQENVLPADGQLSGEVKGFFPLHVEVVEDAVPPLHASLVKRGAPKIGVKGRWVHELPRLGGQTGIHGQVGRGGETDPNPATEAEIVLFVDRAKEPADFGVAGQAQAVLEILVADAEVAAPTQPRERVFDVLDELLGRAEDRFRFGRSSLGGLRLGGQQGGSQGGEGRCQGFSRHERAQVGRRRHGLARSGRVIQFRFLFFLLRTAHGQDQEPRVFQ